MQGPQTSTTRRIAIGVLACLAPFQSAKGDELDSLITPAKSLPAAVALLNSRDALNYQLPKPPSVEEIAKLNPFKLGLLSREQFQVMNSKQLEAVLDRFAELARSTTDPAERSALAGFKKSDQYRIALFTAHSGPYSWDELKHLLNKKLISAIHFEQGGVSLDHLHEFTAEIPGHVLAFVDSGYLQSIPSRTLRKFDKSQIEALDSRMADFKPEQILSFKLEEQVPHSLALAQRYRSEKERRAPLEQYVKDSLSRRDQALEASDFKTLVPMGILPIFDFRGQILPDSIYPRLKFEWEKWGKVNDQLRSMLEKYDPSERVVHELDIPLLNLPPQADAELRGLLREKRALQLSMYNLILRSGVQPEWSLRLSDRAFVFMQEPPARPAPRR